MSDDIGTRLGDLSELPPELRRQLKLSKHVNPRHVQIKGVISSLHGKATIDEILVAFWRAENVVLKRSVLSGFLYNMRTQGLLEVKRDSDPAGTFRLHHQPEGGGE